MAIIILLIILNLVHSVRVSWPCPLAEREVLKKHHVLVVGMMGDVLWILVRYCDVLCVEGVSPLLKTCLL